MDDFDRNIILRAEGIKRELDVSLSQLDIPLLKDRRNINDVVAKALAKAVGALSVGVIEYRITPKPGTRLISLEEGDHFNYDSFLEFLSRNGLSADSTNTVLCSQLTGIYEDPSITGHATEEDFGLKYIPLSNLYGDQIFVLRNNKPIVIYENMDSIKKVIGGSFLCPPEVIDLDSLVEGYIRRKRANFEQRKKRFVAGGNRIEGTEFESFWRAYSSIYFPIQANYGGRNIILGVVGINDIPGWDYKKPPSPETMDVLQSIVNRVSHILIAFESFYKERQLREDLEKVQGEKLRLTEQAARLEGATLTAARVAHDLKTDLGTMGTGIDLARRYLNGGQYGKVAEKLAVTDRALSSSQALVDKLRDLTREWVPNYQMGNLNDYLRSYQYTANESIQVSFNLDSSIPEFYFDKELLGRILLNIVSNSERAIANKQKQLVGYQGKITVHSKNLDGRVEVVIEDNGEGVPNENLPKLGHDLRFTTKLPGEGVGGLGLGIVMNMLKPMNGALRYESKTGEESYTKCDITFDKKTTI